MRIFADPAQARHAPLRELNNGEWMPHAETPARLAAILDAVGTGEAPRDFGMAPIRAVHDDAYCAFLQTAWQRWRDAGRTGEAIGYSFAARGRHGSEPERIDGALGYWGFDAATPIGPDTWASAYASAQCALGAVAALAEGERAAFAACRPPGHHAGRDCFGGYCFLNSAAIAARDAGARGLGPVAVLDVDYHHGNGTQDIFWDDGSVLYASIHADPATDFPYFWGSAAETGAGKGAGTTRNLPLPRGTDWSGYAPALDTALAAIARFGAQTLIVSFGADTYRGDPISAFALETADFTAMGSRVAAAGLPTAIVMEGGYAVEALGANVAAFLAGFA